MEKMLFSEISINGDGCCLVRHEDTVYKVKVIFGQEVRKCDSVEFHLELEQVFRAVLHLTKSDKSIPPIFTNHLMVKALRKDWAICDKIGFRQNSKDLQTSQYYFQFHVSQRPVWKTTQDKELRDKKSMSNRNRETTGKQTIEKPATRDNEREEAESPVRETADRETHNRQLPEIRNSRHRESEKQHTSSRQSHNLVHSRKSEKGQTRNRESDNEEVQRGESKRKSFYAREQENRARLCEGKNRTTSSDSEDGQQENRRGLRRSARISDISSKEIDSSERRSTRKRVLRSAVTELSQSGVTDLDITGGMEEDNSRKKRKSTDLNVDDITGFSYRVNKFRSKVFGKDHQLGKNNRHVLYRAGGCGGRGNDRPPLIMELPEVSPSEDTAGTPNKMKRKRPSHSGKTRTEQQANSSTEKCDGLVAPVHIHKSINDDINVTETVQTSTGQQRATIITRKNRDVSSDSHQSSTSSTNSRSSREEVRKGNKSHSNGRKSLTGSTLKGHKRSSDSPKGHRANTRSSESLKGRRSISPAKDVKIFTRSSTSSKGLGGHIRSVTPSKGLRGRLRSATPSKGLRGRLRSATPSSRRCGMRSTTTSITCKGQKRSATPSEGRSLQLRSTTSSKAQSDRLRSSLPSKSRSGQMQSATPSEGHRVQLRSANSSKAESDRLRSTLPSKSLRRRMRSATPSEESERLVKMRHPVEHGIQVNDVDRYLVQQEELQEMSKLQKMASTHDKQTSYQTRSRKRSGLWNFVDSMIITPARKMFKRI